MNAYHRFTAHLETLEDSIDARRMAPDALRSALAEANADYRDAAARFGRDFWRTREAARRSSILKAALFAATGEC